MLNKDITILRRKLKKARENNQLRNIYEYCCSLAACLTEVEEYEEALVLYKESLTACENLEYNEGAALSHRMIAETCISLGYFDDALQHVNVFLKYALKDNNKVEEQRGLVLKGHVFFTRAEYLTNTKPELVEEIEDFLNESMDAYRKSFAICVSELKDINERERLQMKARLLQNKSLVLIRQNKLDQAQAHLIRAVKICAKEKLKDTECMCYLSLGDLYIRKEEYESALNMYDRAYQLSSTIQKKVDAITAKAKTCLMSNNLERAISILKDSYKKKPNDEIKQILKHVIYIDMLENNLCSMPDTDLSNRKLLYKKLGNIYCELNILKKGIKCYLNMLGCCQKNGSDERDLIYCYKILCAAFKKDKQYDKALFYCNQEVELLKKEPEKACKVYYQIAKLNELNGSDFEEVYYGYLLAKTKCSEFQNRKLKWKCLTQIIRISKKANKTEILEKAVKEMRDEKNNDSGSSCDSDNNDSESEGSESEVCHEWTSESDFDIEDILQKSDDEFRDLDRPKERYKRKKFSIKRNEKGETDLHLAAIKGDCRKVKMLLSQGHPVNVRDAAGWTPLHEACNHGYVDIVNVLVDHGADINDKGGPCCDGITPLHDAAINGQMEVIDILIKKGASVLVLNNFGETPLQCLLKWKKNSALEGEEETTFKKIVKALKSPLDLKNQPFLQLKNNSAEEKVEAINGNSRNIKNLLPNNNASSTYSGRKRQSTCKSSDDLQHSDSDESTSSEKDNACDLYRSAMNNLRHKPKKFKTLESSKSVKKTALVDAEDYVENCILENDEEEDFKEDTDQLEDCAFIVEKNKNDVKKAEVIQSSPSSETSFKVNFSDFEEDCLDELMKELEGVPSVSKRSQQSSEELSNFNSGTEGSTLKIVENDLNQSQIIAERVRGFTSLCESNETDVQKDASLNSSNDSGLCCSKILNSTETITSESITNIYVKINNDEIKIPVKTSEIEKLKFDWLINEVAKQYSVVENCDYHVSMKNLETNSFLSDTDPLMSLGNAKVEFITTKLKLFPLSERYEMICTKKNHFDIIPESRSTTFKYTVNPQIRDILKISASSRCFVLSNLKLTSLTLVPICKAIKYESFVQKLNLSNNYFGDKGVELIIKILEMCIIEELDLSGCNVTSSGVYHFSDSLIKLNELSRNGLQILNFSKNPITDDAVEAINNIIEKLPNLTCFNIDYCELETKISNPTQNLIIVQGNSLKSCNSSVTSSFL